MSNKATSSKTIANIDSGSIQIGILYHLTSFVYADISFFLRSSGKTWIDSMILSFFQRLINPVNMLKPNITNKILYIMDGIILVSNLCPLRPLPE